MAGHTTVELLCAHNNGKHYSYASSSGRNEMEAEIRQADVLVVGAGLGGHAAAASVQDYGKGAATHIIYSPSAGSTSSRSTGVVWFPLNHTYDELMEASGSDVTTETHLRAYLDLGPASKTYWYDKLQLQPYSNPYTGAPAPDYTPYHGGAKQGNSFQHRLCGPGGDLPCGSRTLQHMQDTLGVALQDGYNVTNVEPTRTGFRVTHTALGKEVNETFRAVIFANGGSGRYNGFDSNRILAGDDNTGIHMHVAEQLGLTMNTHRNLKWGLEFQQDANANGSWPNEWQEKWFSFGCAPQGVPAYEECGDYNNRTLSWPDDVPRESEVVNVSHCEAESASFKFWKDLMDIYLSAEGGAIAYDKYLCGDNVDLGSGADAFHRLAPGMIDGKDGFVTNPQTMESIDMPGLYAVGTSGAYGLGNTYFGPGATLGWALHSGRLAGSAAATHVANAKKNEAKEEARVVPAKRKSPKLITGFRWGSWLLLTAVVFHMFGDVRKAAAWVHYVLAPIAVAVLLTTAYSALGQHKKDRMMQQIDSSKSRMHARLGKAAGLLLVIQVALGVCALHYNVAKGRSAALSTLHRVLGWLLLVVVAGLYWTSVETAPLYDDNKSKLEAWGEARTFSTAVVACVVFALCVALVEPQRRLKAAGGGVSKQHARYILLHTRIP